MAFAAGVFTPSTLATAIKVQGAVFKKSPNLYMPQTEVLREIVKMQTADVADVAGSAFNQIKIAWQNSQGIQAAACNPSCLIDGPQTGTDAQVFTLTGCTQTTFKKEVPVGNDPTSVYAGGVITYAESLAQDMMQAKKVLQEQISAMMLAKLGTFAGVNADNTGQYGAVVGTGAASTTTTIPAANWNENLYTYLQMEASINRLAVPYVLDGVQNGLYLRHLNAIPNALNDNQRDQAAKFNLIETVYDYFSFAKAGIVNTDYVVDGTAVAFAARNIHPNAVPEQVSADTVVYSIDGAPTQAFDGTVSAPSLFKIDVMVQRRCDVINGVRKWFDVFEYKVPYFDLIADPYRLGGGTNTGVLKFQKAA